MSKPQKKIKTLWFDLGNVVLFFDFGPAYRKLRRHTGLRAETIRRYFHARPRLEASLDEGRVNARSLYRRLRKDLGLLDLSFGRFKEVWNDIFWENRAVIRLLGRLKRRGYRLILISNTNRLHYDHIRRRYPVLKLFHRQVLSFRVGARKPERRIYRLALKHSRARPDEIFYTDDREELTTVAFSNHGVHTHTFRSAPSLIRALRKLGVKA